MEFVKKCFRHVHKAMIRDRRNLQWKVKRIRHGRIRRAALDGIANQPMRYALNREKREVRFTVSMASYPPRFPILPVVLKRLMDQTVKPDRLILYLDDNVKPEDVPEAVRALEPYGLDIRFCPYDLKPHKKYFFAMQEFPYDVVIPVDDDMIYPRNLIETLAASYRRFPGCVSAAKAHKIAFSKDESILPYGQWTWNCGELNRPSMGYLAVGACGILYPPRAIPAEGFDVEAIRALTLNTDDIWLKFVEMRTGAKVVICGGGILRRSVEVEARQKGALKETDLRQGVNDKNIAAMMVREHLDGRAFLP